MFYPLVLQFYYKKWEKEKKKMILTKEKKKNSTKTKQCYHDMISADGKGTLFIVKLKLQGTSFYLNKYIENKIFKK